MRSNRFKKAPFRMEFGHAISRCGKRIGPNQSGRVGFGLTHNEKKKKKNEDMYLPLNMHLDCISPCYVCVFLFFIIFYFLFYWDPRFTWDTVPLVGLVHGIHNLFDQQIFHKNVSHQWVLCTVHETHKPHFSVTFSLKMGLTTLFTYLKIILLQYFQFSTK